MQCGNLDTVSSSKELKADETVVHELLHTYVSSSKELKVIFCLKLRGKNEVVSSSKELKDGARKGPPQGHRPVSSSKELKVVLRILISEGKDSFILKGIEREVFTPVSV